VQLLAASVQQPADEVLDVLEEALAAQVIRAGNAVDSYRFQQELIQETLYAELSIAQRRRLNGMVARALERLHAGDLAPHYAQLARHYAAAGPGEDAEKAFQYAVKAGDRAMAQFAWEAAVAHFDRALQSLEVQANPDPTQHCAVLLALGEAQNRVGLGRPRQNASLGAGASPIGRDTFWRAAEVARSASLPTQLAQAALGVVGFNPHAQQAGVEGVRLLEEALDLLPTGESPLRVRLLARLGVDPYMLAFAGTIPFTPDVAAQLRTRSDDAVAMARRLGDPVSLAYALVMRGLQYALHSHEERLAGANQVIQAAEAANDLQLTAWGYFLKNKVFLELGDMAAAHVALEQLEAVANQLQLPYFLWTVANSHTGEALDAGRYEEAERLIQHANSIQPRSAATTIQRITVRRQRGQIDGLLELFEELPRRGHVLTRSHWIACLLETQPDDARRAMEGSIVDDVLNAPLCLRGMAWLAEACFALGDATHAAALYPALLPHAEYNAMTPASDYTGGSVTYYLGLLATTMGHWAEAERHFVDSLRMNEQRGIRPYFAYTQYAYAAMLVQRGEPGDREHALDLVDQTLAGAKAMGMVKLANDALTLKVQIQGILKA
jgi:tetratricopeptide (TPR) repeat protein